MILEDESTPAFLDDLVQAWKPGTASFALLPQKFDQGKPWVEKSLKALPDALRTDHFLLSTSGSTGAPKFLVASRARAVAMANQIGLKQGVSEGDTAIITLPLSYCFSFINQWVLGQTIGLQPVFARLSDPDGLTQALQDNERGMLCLVAAQVPLLKALAGTRFPRITTVAFAGSPFPWAHATTLADLFPNARFFDNYGCAEAMPRLTIQDVTEYLRAGTPPPAGQLGTALPGISFHISDAGELMFQSPYAALGTVTPDGYVPFDTNAWVGTGDQAEQDQTGVWWLQGRANEVFKRHGEKVSLLRLRLTVEKAWRGEYALSPATDRSGEPGVQLILAGQADRATARGILQTIRAAHPRAHWPLQIIRVDNLPRLSNSKIDLQALKMLPDKEILWDQRV